MSEIGVIVYTVDGKAWRVADVNADLTHVANQVSKSPHLWLPVTGPLYSEGQCAGVVPCHHIVAVRWERAQ